MLINNKKLTINLELLWRRGILFYIYHIQGRIQGEGAPALKLEKIWFFGAKSWFIKRNTPKFFAPASARRNFFKSAPPLTWNPGSAPDIIEEFEDTKGVTRIRKSKNDRQHNGQKKKRTNNDLQNSTQNKRSSSTNPTTNRGVNPCAL